MKHHKIKLEPFIHWLDENWTNYASDSNTGKALECNHRGVFRVISYHIKDQIYWTGDCPETAVEKYNEL